MTTKPQTTTTATALQTQGQTGVATRPIDQVRGLLDKMKPQIKLALPKHVDPDRMLRIVLTTVQRTPKLLECTRESLLGCIVQCAQLGLEPDGMLGHAYLIPFVNRKEGRTECQLIVGYKGLLKLARQSGEISNIVARVVHEKDDFQFEYGLERDVLIHRPTPDPDPGKITHAYAIFRLKDGATHFDVMTTAQIERIRDGSQGYQRDKERSPWTNHFEEMAKKTVLRRASKMAPASIEDRLARAVVLDERADAGLPQDIVDVPEISGGDSTPANDGGESDQSATIVVSTLRQRKDIIAMAKRARVDVASVAETYGKATIEELTSDEADAALAKLTAAVDAEASDAGDQT